MNKILITLDSMVDTRLAILLSEFNYDDLDNYRNRKSDNFKGIGREVFRYRYSKRDRDTLLLSVRTDIHKILPMVITEIKNKLTLERQYLPIEVHIDIHPYILADKETTLIQNSLKRIIKTSIDTQIVSNPSYKDYSIIIDYDGIYKLDKMVFRDIYLPNSVLLVPDIVDNDNLDNLSVMTELLSPFIQLQPIHPSLFSIEEKNTIS